MRCECGKEILNVPEHLWNSAKWQCKECGRNIDTAGHKVEAEAEFDIKKLIEIRKKAA